MPSSKIYGLIGYPVKHSLSALMHNAAFKALNIPAEYRLFEIKPDKLEDFLCNGASVADIQGSAVRLADLSGFNITIPHKIKAREILNRKLPLVEENLMKADLYYVKLTGAINTVKIEGEMPVEYLNTDAFGFRRSLREDLSFDAANKTALVIGCGGAGRAVIAALSWIGVCKKIYIYEKELAAVEAARRHFFEGELSKDWINLLNEKLEFIPQNKAAEAIGSSDLLVNASPVGMKEGDPSVIDKQLLHKNLHVYDVVYNRETQLVKDAKTLVRSAVGGKGMLLYQGAAAFELWTGQKAPIEAMRKALTEHPIL